MSQSGFEEFAEAVASQNGGAASRDIPKFEEVAVLGGGRDARLIAALCLAEGAQVTLFSAYGTELETLRSSGGVTIRGAGPVGTYQVDQDAGPSIRLTGELDRCVDAAKVIFLTGPVHKQRTYAMVLADHLQDGQVLVLAPGRSLGAAEAAWLLRVGGCQADVTVVETQGLPFWVEAEGAKLVLSTAANVPAATLPSGRGDVLQALARFIPNMTPVVSTIHSGFADGSGLVEIPALLVGGVAVGNGMQPLPVGAEPLEQNQTFRALIGSGQRALIRRLAHERTEVAWRFGVHSVPTVEEWVDAHGGALKGDGARPIPGPDEARQVVRCAVIGSLAPLASAARMCGVSVPTTDAMIVLASAILGGDVGSAGRHLQNVGVDVDDVDDARRVLDAIAKGVR